MAGPEERKVKSLRELSRVEIEPARDLWPGIEARLEARRPRLPGEARRQRAVRAAAVACRRRDGGERRGGGVDRSRRGAPVHRHGGSPDRGIHRLAASRRARRSTPPTSAIRVTGTSGPSCSRSLQARSRRYRHRRGQGHRQSRHHRTRQGGPGARARQGSEQCAAAGTAHQHLPG